MNKEKTTHGSPESDYKGGRDIIIEDAGPVKAGKDHQDERKKAREINTHHFTNRASNNNHN